MADYCAGPVFEVHASLLRRAADRLEQMSEAEVLALGPIGALISLRRRDTVNQFREHVFRYEGPSLALGG